MTDLTRRTMLAGAAAAAAAPLAATSSAAAAPRRQAGAELLSLQDRDYELTTILDGVRQVKLDVSPIRNAKLEDVQAVLAASYLPKDQVGYYFHPTVVNTGSKLVLIDTGNGPGHPDRHRDDPANLAAAGIDPKTIDIVVISHFHGDHISGLRTADGALAYPNAEIKVPAKEWSVLDRGGQRQSRAARPAADLPEHQAHLRSDRRQGDEIRMGQGGRAGILAQDTNGHTPGHTAFVVASGSGKVLIQADVTAGYAPLVVANPTWQVGGDMDGTQAEATRRKLYDMLAADRMLVSGYHFPFPSLPAISRRRATAIA